MKDHHKDDFKASNGSASTPASASTQDSKPFKKVKKKKHYRGKKDSRKPKDSSTLASGVHAAEIGGGRQKKKNKKDISRVMCFKCNKKGHFSDKCLKPPKN